jgi:hypothetical protein
LNKKYKVGYQSQSIVKVVILLRIKLKREWIDDSLKQANEEEFGFLHDLDLLFIIGGRCSREARNGEDSFLSGLERR